jgi:hypothetical protein
MSKEVVGDPSIAVLCTLGHVSELEVVAELLAESGDGDAPDCRSHHAALGSQVNCGASEEPRTASSACWSIAMTASRSWLS